MILDKGKLKCEPAYHPTGYKCGSEGSSFCMYLSKLLHVIVIVVACIFQSFIRIFQSFTCIFQSCYMLNISSRLVTNVEASGVRRLCPGLIYGRQPLHSNIKIFQIGQSCIKIYQRNAATRGGDGGTYETCA